MYCLWENKARREGRRQGNVEKYQALWDSGKTRAPIGDRSPDFLFTLWKDIIQNFVYIHEIERDVTLYIYLFGIRDQ